MISNLPQIPKFRPLELFGVASRLNPELKNIPTVDSVLVKIAENKSDSITCLEWFCCVNGKLEWDRQRSVKIANETSLKLWSAAKQDIWLRKYLLKSLILSTASDRLLAASIAKAFKLCFNEFFVGDKLVEIVSAIITSSDQLAQVANKHKFSKSKIFDLISEELVIKIDIPDFVSGVISYFKNNAAAKVSAKSVKGLESWLLNCLKEEQDVKQGEAVSQILMSVPKEIGSQFPELVSWLKQNYRVGEKVNYLTPEAKQKLKEWVGAVNYGDFAKLVDLLLDNLPELSHDNYNHFDREGRRKENFQRNQLEKRMYFWSNYSDRFEQIRIFIPSSSRNAIGSSLISDITILQPDGISESTEVCAFDFGTHIVVEFFRGKGSETRLFDCRANPSIRETIFNSSNLTICKIRRLGGERHDHVFLWQYYCERWLAKQNIFPNSNLKRFKILYNQYYDYNPKMGMPSIDYEKRLDREKKREGWEKEMSRLESQISRDCN